MENTTKYLKKDKNNNCIRLQDLFMQTYMFDYTYNFKKIKDIGNCKKNNTQNVECSWQSFYY